MYQVLRNPHTQKTLEPTSELKILQKSIVFINTKKKSKNDTSVASKDLQNDTYNSVKIVKQLGIY